MQAANFINPMDAVQTIPIFIYLNVLSDFLYGENLLNEIHLCQPIPIVNALYHHFFDNIKNNARTSLKMKQIYLAKKLINGTDYYGAEEKEKLDENFINALFKHIISSFVFDKYINIYGFLAEIVYTSNNLNLQNFLQKVQITLSKAQFQNEYGPDSSLEPIAVYKICNDLIFPLFPIPEEDFNLTSVDYIYGQAGAILQLAVQNPPIIKLDVCKESETTNGVSKFTGYKLSAHAVELSVRAGKVSFTALNIFTLPALIHYVYKEKQNLKIHRIAKIVDNSTLIEEAIKILFLDLNTSLLQIEKVQNDDYRYQFHLAMSQFKNRTILAKNIIHTHCSVSSDENVRSAITDYENNPEDYQCNNKVLPNVNNIYQEQVDNISKKYFLYERESMREAFGINRAKSLNGKVKISEGFFVRNPSRQATSDLQLIDKSTNMFRLYFPDNGTYTNYAFLRKDDEVTLIQGSDDDQNFKQKLGLERETIENRNFYTKNWNYAPVKTINELFDAIAEERKIEFSKSLFSFGYDQTRKEWWIDFGLSLIPFYSCVHGIESHNVEGATVSCSLDVFFLLPIVGQIGSIASKLITATTRSALSLAGTTIESIMLRTVLRKTLSTLGEVLVKEVVSEFSLVLTKATLKNLGLSVVRFLDPGFELLFTIGKGGYRFLRKLIMKALGKKLIFLKFPSLMKMLKNLKVRVVITFWRKVDVMKERNMYVHSLSKKKKSGYGYKYIILPNGKVAEVRKVAKSEEKMLMAFERTTEQDEKLYKAIDLGTNEISNKVLYKRNGQLYDHPTSGRFKLELNFYQECKKFRRKRCATNSACMLTSFSNSEKNYYDENAIKYAVQHLGLSESSVRAELRKYIFAGKGELQLIFVQHWEQSVINNNWEILDWSSQFKIADPEMFIRLRYEEILDKAKFTEQEAKDIIFSISDTDPDLYLLNSAPSLTTSFHMKEMYKDVTFKDYCALHNFINSGFFIIGSNTLESRCMREALYRLAIRQFDRIEEFPKTLFRGEKRSREAVTRLFYSGRKELEFNRFTSTSSVEKTAKKFTGSESLDNLDSHEFSLNSALAKEIRELCGAVDISGVDIIYKMEFEKPCLSANLQNGINNLQNEVVLFPGTRFKIKSKLEVPEKNIVMVELSYIHDYTSKELLLKNAMDELEKLKRNDILTYDLDGY